MNMLKRLLATILAASLLLAGTNASAQASIGIGYANSPIKMALPNILDLSKTYALNGFYIGGSYNISLGDNALGIAPGLYYTYLTAGSTEFLKNEETGKGRVKGSFSEHYLSIPVMLNLGFDIADGIVGRIYAGPTLSYGLASDWKLKTKILDLGTSLSTYDLISGYDRMDVMVGGGLALEFYQMVRFDIGYDYGLLNRYSGGESGNFSIHRSQLKAGISYMF